MTAKTPDEMLLQELSDLRQRVDDLETQLALQRMGAARLKLFEDLVEQSTVGIVIVTLDGRIHYLNATAAHLYGFDERIDAFNLPVTELFPSEERERAQNEILQRLHENGLWQGEIWGARADGSRFLAELSSLMLTNPQQSPTMLAFFVRDITVAYESEQERQRLLEETRRQASELRMFKMMVDNAQDGIVFTNMDNTVLYSNQAFQNMSGFGTQAIGSSIQVYYHQNELQRLTNELLPSIQKHGAWEGVLQLQRPDGEQWLAQGSVFVVTDDDGIQGRASIWRDVTDQKRSEQERADLQQQVIEAQQAALRELSTPLIPLAEGVLVMPLVGNIDHLRAQQVVETLLHGVSQQRTKTVLLDITGVPIVDTHVAGALINSARAVRLLGAQVVLTGIRPEVAQTLVGLGVELNGLVTLSSLQSGITYAFRQR